MLSFDDRVLKPEDLKREYVVKGLERIKIQSDMKFLGIIPAYASTRFLRNHWLCWGKTVIQRVYEQVAGILDDAYVATDDERIEAAVKHSEEKVVMTSIDHKKWVPTAAMRRHKDRGRL